MVVLLTALVLFITAFLIQLMARTSWFARYTKMQYELLPTFISCRTYLYIARVAAYAFSLVCAVLGALAIVTLIGYR